MLVAVETVEVVGVEPVWSQVEEQITSAPFSFFQFLLEVTTESQLLTADRGFLQGILEPGKRWHDLHVLVRVEGKSWYWRAKALENLQVASFAERILSSEPSAFPLCGKLQVPSTGSTWNRWLHLKALSELCPHLKHLPNAIGRNAQNSALFTKWVATFFYPSNYPSNSWTDREQDWL